MTFNYKFKYLLTVQVKFKNNIKYMYILYLFLGPFLDYERSETFVPPICGHHYFYLRKYFFFFNLNSTLFWFLNFKNKLYCIFIYLDKQSQAYALTIVFTFLAIFEKLYKNEGPH